MDAGQLINRPGIGDRYAGGLVQRLVDGGLIVYDPITWRSWFEPLKEARARGMLAGDTIHYVQRRNGRSRKRHAVYVATTPGGRLHIHHPRTGKHEEIEPGRAAGHDAHEQPVRLRRLRSALESVKPGERNELENGSQRERREKRVRAAIADVENEGQQLRI